jgi:hypothetical protein
MVKQRTPTHRRNKEVFHYSSSVPCQILRFTVQNMFNVANVYTGQKISFRCTYFVFAIFSSNEKSCAAIPLHFHVVPATSEHIYRNMGRAFLFPADVRPCPAVSATVHNCFMFKFPGRQGLLRRRKQMKIGRRQIPAKTGCSEVLQLSNYKRR